MDTKQDGAALTGQHTSAVSADEPGGAGTDSSGGVAEPADGSAGVEPVLAMKTQHAFFVVGTDVLFLVHMGNSWIDCHRYQVILRITVPEDVRKKILSDRQQHPGQWHIIGNVSQDLLSLPDIHRGARRSYNAHVWRGWPTQPGTEHWPWANDPPVFPEQFQVTVDRVVYFRRLDFNLDYPRTASYVLFGEGGEAHINHSFIKQPDYDHVATLTVPPRWLPASLLESSVPINFPAIPAVPGGTSCREAVHETNPLGGGIQYVQYGGQGPRRPLHVKQTIFFGTWPFNRTNLENGDPWDPCG